MKTLVLGLLVIGFTSLGLAQDKNEAVSGVQNLEDVIVLSVNADYLSTVQDENTPGAVKELELEAANYDIKTKPHYDKKEKNFFEVVFRSGNGEIVAFYDSRGEIITSYENFNDILLPLEVREMLLKENNGWEVDRNQYICIYDDHKILKRVYKIRLTNGNDTKKLQIPLIE